jgi:hypothetical protein
MKEIAAMCCFGRHGGRGKTAKRMAGRGRYLHSTNTKGTTTVSIVIPMTVSSSENSNG